MTKEERAKKIAKDKKKKTVSYSNKKDEKNKNRRGGTSHLLKTGNNG